MLHYQQTERYDCLLLLTALALALSMLVVHSFCRIVNRGILTRYIGVCLPFTYTITISSARPGAAAPFSISIQPTHYHYHLDTAIPSGQELC